MDPSQYKRIVQAARKVLTEGFNITYNKNMNGTQIKQK